MPACASSATVSVLAVSPVIKIIRVATSGRCRFSHSCTSAPVIPPGVRKSEITPRKSLVARISSPSAALGASTEALIELFYAPGTLLDQVTETLRRHPEVVEAWSVTGEADAIARVRTHDNADLERLIMELQREGLVERTRSQVVLSRLVHR